MRRLGIVCALAALAAAGRLADPFPNVAPTYWVAFLAGAAYGARAGAAVGALSMAVTDVLLTGPHPVILVNTPAMALVGAAGGLVRASWFETRASRVAASAACGMLGVALTFAFSVAADLADFAIRVGPAADWAPRALGALLVAGLAFNVLPAAINGAIFALATGPALRALDAAGLLRERGRARRRTPTSATPSDGSRGPPPEEAGKAPAPRPDP